MEPCLLFHEGGHWRELTVRTNSQGHTMAIITFHPQGLSQVGLPGKEVTSVVLYYAPGSFENFRAESKSFYPQNICVG